jgi:putative FmdB family regulatory protein
MPLFEYACSCGTRIEEYRSIATRDHAPACHGPMQRVLSAPRLVNAPTGAGIRSQFSQFREASEELAHHNVDTSGLWNAARARAKGLEADGVTTYLP